MDIIYTVVIVAFLLVGFVAYQAHKNGVSLEVQADKDLAAVKAQYDKDIAALKADVQKLKTDVAVHEVKLPVAPVVTVAPVAPPAPIVVAAPVVQAPAPTTPPPAA